MALFTLPFPYSSSTQTSQAAVTASSTLVSRHDNRGEIILSMSGSATAYILYGTGSASASTCSFVMNNGDVFKDDIYKGAISVNFSKVDATSILFATEVV